MHSWWLGHRHACNGVVPLLKGVRIRRQRGGRPRQRPRHLVGDKGYSNRHVRLWARLRHVRLTVPERADQRRSRATGFRPAFDREAYRRHNIISSVL